MAGGGTGGGGREDAGREKLAEGQRAKGTAGTMHAERKGEGGSGAARREAISGRKLRRC